MYRVGLPFWKFLARLGVPMHLRVLVQRDAESSMFVAVSPDLKGLIVEAETMDELVTETRDVIDMLLDEYLSNGKHAEPEFRMRGTTSVCA